MGSRQLQHQAAHPGGHQPPPALAGKPELFEEEKEFILCDNCIATCNTRSKLPMVMRFNLLTVLILKVMATSFLAQVPYLSVV